MHAVSTLICHTVSLLRALLSLRQWGLKNERTLFFSQKFCNERVHVIMMHMHIHVLCSCLAGPLKKLLGVDIHTMPRRGIKLSARECALLLWLGAPALLTLD